MGKFEFKAMILVVSLLASNFTYAGVILTSDETIFNFDFTTESLAPPYDSIEFGASFNAADPVSGSDVFVASLYGGLDGTGLIQERFDTILVTGGLEYGPLSTANPIFDPMLDGIFSIGLKVLNGSAELNSIYAKGVVFSPFATTDEIVFTSVVGVPAPATLGLLLLGLISLTGSRLKGRFGQT